MNRPRQRTDRRRRSGGRSVAGGLAPVALLAACLVLPLAAPARAQSPVDAAPADAEAPPPSQPFYDSVDVRLVVVEVTVTDADGEPVAGLERGDFEVYEDGRPVEVSHFAAVEDRLATAGGEPETRRLQLVVFVDSANLEAHERSRLLGELRAAVAGGVLAPEDLVMVVERRAGLDVVLESTTDRAALDAALAELAERLPPPGAGAGGDLMRRIQNVRLGDFRGEAVQQAESLAAAIRRHVDDTRRRMEASAVALERFCSSLAGLPGRKALLYLGGGLPARPGAALVQAWSDKLADRLSGADDLRLRTEAAAMQNLQGTDLTPLFHRLAEHAAAQGVAFYAVADLGRRGSRASAEVAGGAAGGVAVSPEVAVLDAFSRESSLLALAAGSGGRAHTRGHDVSALLDELVTDFGWFYSLGFQPATTDSELHRLEVKVRDGSWRVRHGRGHRQRGRLERLESRTLSALYYGVADNPLDARIDVDSHQETASGEYRVPVLIKIPFRNLTFLPRDGGHASRVLAVVVAQDEKRDISLFQRVFLPIELAAEAQQIDSDTLAAYRVDLVMRPGEHRVAVGLRDEIAEVESTLFLDVAVGAGRPAGAAADVEPAEPPAEPPPIPESGPEPGPEPDPDGNPS